MTRVLGITGASGYIGRALIKRCSDAGWRPVAIGRSMVGDAIELRQADLSQPMPPDLLRGLDAIIHLAADTSGTYVAHDSEVTFAHSLAEACHRADISLVFVSSQAVSSSTPSVYGRTKAAIEKSVRPFGTIIVRPGLVIGGDEAGLFGTMVSLVRRCPILPMLLPRPMVQPVHVGDLVNVLLAALDRRDLASRTISVADDPIALDELLMKIAHHRLRVRRVRIPIPALLVRVALALAAPTLGPRFSPERLDSLTGLMQINSGPDLEKLGLSLCPLPQALDRRSSCRRCLLLEARSLARATIARPGPGFMRRYARLLPKFGVVLPLNLPASVLMSPVLIAALDVRTPHEAPVSSLSWRMNLVMRLAECEPAWAARFIPLAGDAGLTRACLSFARGICSELHVRSVAPLVRHLLRASR